MIKRIIPILIVIVICVSVITFNTFALLNEVSYISFDVDTIFTSTDYTYHSINPITISYYGYIGGNTIEYNVTVDSVSINKTSGVGAAHYVRFKNTTDNIVISFTLTTNNTVQAISNSKFLATAFATFSLSSDSYLDIEYTNNSYNNHIQVYFSRNFNISEIGLSGFSIQNIRYNLYFNSNGGSLILPITDIEPNSTINLVGQFGEYLPQFVPVKQFYEFSGWALTQNGTNISRVTITKDTTLYANWTADPRNTSISYDTANGCINYYGNQNHTSSPPSLVLSGNNVSINVYYEITNQVPNGYYLSYFNINENGSTYRITPDALYINLIVDTPGYIQITPVFTQLKTLTVLYNPAGSTQDNTMQFGVLEPAYRGGASVTLTGSYAYPMFITKVRLVGNSSHRIYEIDFQDSWDEQENNFYFEMYFTMPNEDSTITVFWSVMGGVAPLPVVSYDESGNAYFMGVSEENLFSQDFSSARDLIPKDFVGIVEYFGALQGLSIVVTIILVAGFAAFLLRRA